MVAVSSEGAIFVLPATTAPLRGPVGAWSSTAGWAAAGRRVLGASWIVTPTGLVTPEQARRRAAAVKVANVKAPAVRRHIPTVAKTAVKDVRQFRRGRQFHIDPGGPWEGIDLAFVWQRHVLFQMAGIDLATRLGVPSALFVPAALVWEASQWEVGRPGWGGVLEKIGERPAMSHADVVACGSDVVAEQVRRFKIGHDRIVVTPTGVDLELFSRRPESEQLRRRLRLEDRFVVGWSGSFRRFHALEYAVEALSGIDGSVLFLVGDGPELASVRRLARERGVAVKCTGTVPHSDVATYIGAMDVGLVLAHPGRPFHYSPLKLAEYLAVGVPVIAPRVGQLAQRLRDGVDSLLVAPGDVDAMVDALRFLRDDPIEAKRLGVAARETAEREFSWDAQIRKITSLLRQR